MKIQLEPSCSARTNRRTNGRERWTDRH